MNKPCPCHNHLCRPAMPRQGWTCARCQRCISDYERGEPMMELDKPMVFFDLETTGTDVSKDRIVQIGMMRIEPDDHRQGFNRLINPGCPVPAEASLVHGITDTMLRDSPPLEDVLDDMDAFFDGADLGGFNITGFDIPLLQSEYARCGREFSLDGRRIVDAMTIYHRMEPRNLAGAVSLYCGYELENAHDALADVVATVDVLEGQLERYSDLPGTVEELSLWCRGNNVTLDGKVVWNEDGLACLSFGKHAGIPFRFVPTSYLSWLMNQSFPKETKDVISDAMRSVYPRKREDSKR